MKRTLTSLIAGIVASSLWGTSLLADPTTPHETRGIISGGVADRSGNPMADVVTTATEQEVDEPGTWSDQTNGEGFYALVRVNPGSTYRVSAARPGHVFREQVVSLGDSGPRTVNWWDVDFTEEEPSLTEVKLGAEDGDWGHEFGCSVSIDGNYAVIGADRDDEGALLGSAYVFKRSGDTWTQQAKLLPCDGMRALDFGCSVSISGDYAIVGDDLGIDNGHNAGSAYVFKRTGDTWAEQARLRASDAEGLDYFGCSVSISGDYAVIGAWGDDDKGDCSGSAYVFKRSGDTWVQQAKLLASDGAWGDESGWSVSMSGDYAIIGACLDDDQGYDAGSAYVFRRTGDIWVEQAKLVAHDGAAGDHFGWSVSISGDCAIIGADFDGDKGLHAGSAYVFNRTGGAWVQRAKLLASDGGWGDEFGWSVSVSGDCAVIGADADDDMGNDGGSAYVFRRTGGTWVQQAKLLASDGGWADEFGWSVSISGGYAIIGALRGDGKASCSGSTYVFNLGGYAHTLTATSTAGGSVHIMVIIDGVAQGWLGDQTLRFDHGTQIELRADPDPGHAFKNWSGTLWSTDDPLIFTLDQDHTLTANFVPLPTP